MAYFIRHFDNGVISRYSLLLSYIEDNQGEFVISNGVLVKANSKLTHAVFWRDGGAIFPFPNSLRFKGKKIDWIGLSADWYNIGEWRYNYFLKLNNEYRFSYFDENYEEQILWQDLNDQEWQNVHSYEIVFSEEYIKGYRDGELLFEITSGYVLPPQNFVHYIELVSFAGVTNFYLDDLIAQGRDVSSVELPPGVFLQHDYSVGIDTRELPLAIVRGSFTTEEREGKMSLIGTDQPFPSEFAGAFIQRADGFWVRRPLTFEFYARWFLVLVLSKVEFDYDFNTSESYEFCFAPYAICKRDINGNQTQLWTTEDTGWQELHKYTIEMTEEEIFFYRDNELLAQIEDSDYQEFNSVNIGVWSGHFPYMIFAEPVITGVLFKPTFPDPVFPEPEEPPPPPAEKRAIRIEAQTKPFYIARTRLFKEV